MLKSVSNVAPTGVMNGATVFNIMLDDTLIRKEDNFDKLVLLLESYFNMGGLHFQLNYLAPGTLLDAQAHPEKYKGLRVRVSGFSAYFTGLNIDIQNDVIHRTVKTV